MKVKTSELTGAPLDWALEECLLNRALDKVWAIADQEMQLVLEAMAEDEDEDEENIEIDLDGGLSAINE